jgi:lysozyme family protein
MSRNRVGRRELLTLSIGVSTIGLLAGSAAAKGRSIRDILGIDLPPELLKILPTKPLNLVRTISTILALEKEADARRLPLSLLPNRADVPLVASEASLYQAALPRLITLIDRAEDSDGPLADQAGEVLADINASQHVVPDALKPPAAVPPLSRGHNYTVLKPEYARLFSSASVREEHRETVDWHFSMIKKYRARYEGVGSSVAVPWYFIAAIHGLESSFNFRAHLHNGDFPLTARTRQVPAGRPVVWLPPADWESSAKDALRLLGFTGQSDWSLERTLYRLEAYNGFGYRMRGVPTPYLWSFCNHYEAGKFVSDGSWNAKAKSQQCGSATILKLLADAGDISFPG